MPLAEDDEWFCDMWPIRILRPFELSLGIHREDKAPSKTQNGPHVKSFFSLTIAHTHKKLKNFTTGFQSEVLMYRKQYTSHVFLIPDFGFVSDYYS